MLRTQVLSSEEMERRKQEREAEERLDSLRLGKVMSRALQFALRNKARKSFQHEFGMLPDDTSYTVETRMVFGNLFATNKKHLVIRRSMPGAVIFDVLLLEANRFKKATQEGLLVFMYLDDTLQDVNGDHYKDLVVHWYPSSGCCRREAYEVLLYLPEEAKFTKSYGFINPTFFSREKIIRGVGYGHPGEVGLYKKKWNGLKLDEVEFIYPHPTDGDKFIKTKSASYKPTEKDGVVLSSLPREYRKIESIEWFLGYKPQ